MKKRNPDVEIYGKTGLWGYRLRREKYLQLRNAVKRLLHGVSKLPWGNVGYVNYRIPARGNDDERMTMMKSDCEKRLERMQTERDHWRNKAREKDATIADLRRQLERAQMWESAFAGGVRADMDKQIEQLQVERDRYLKAIENYCVLTETMIEKQSNTGVIRDILERLSNMENLPHLPRMILNAGGYAEQQNAARQNQLVNWLSENDLSTITIADHPNKALVMTRYDIFQAAIQEITANLAMYAYGFADDPALIADEILRECRLYGEPKIETVGRFTLHWITKHLPNLKGGPPKPETLQHGLNIAHKFIQSGVTQATFAAQNLLHARYVRLYVKWYRTLEEWSLKKPHEIKTKLEETEGE